MRNPDSTPVARNARQIATALAWVAAMGGCGGGSGAGPAPPPPPPPPGAIGPTGGGFWHGFLARDGEFHGYASCLLSESGELACLLHDPANDSGDGASWDSAVAALHGTLQFSGTSQASGSGTIYATPGHEAPDGNSVIADLTITDGLLTRSNTRIELTFSSLGEVTTFHGDYDPSYSASAIGVVFTPTGVYTDFDIYGDPASLTIDEDGTVFVQTAAGCSGNGLVINADPEHVPGTVGYNAFTVDVTINNCQELNGDFVGLANFVTFEYENGNDVLLITMFSDTKVIFDTAVK